MSRTRSDGLYDSLSVDAWRLPLWMPEGKVSNGLVNSVRQRFAETGAGNGLPRTRKLSNGLVNKSCNGLPRQVPYRGAGALEHLVRAGEGKGLPCTRVLWTAPYFAAADEATRSR